MFEILPWLIKIIGINYFNNEIKAKHFSGLQNDCKNQISKIVYTLKSPSNINPFLS